MVYTVAPGFTTKDNVWVSHDGFLLNEDDSLKTWLSGMTVSDDKNSSRPVPVWFAMPDMEVRDQKFPFVVLELVGVVEAKDREHRGLLKVINDRGSNVLYPDGHRRWVEEPLPINLIYQATAYARHPRHHRQIVAQMLSQKVPGRLMPLPVTADSSLRYMELTSWVSRDTIESGRKLWQTVYTISVASEISELVSTAPAPPVLEVNVETEQNVTDVQNA